MLEGGESRFRSPADAASHPWGEQRPTADELRVATLDAQCKTNLRYVEAAGSLEATWLAEHLDEYLGDLELLTEARNDLIDAIGAETRG